MTVDISEMLLTWDGRVQVLYVNVFNYEAREAFDCQISCLKSLGLDFREQETLISDENTHARFDIKQAVSKEVSYIYASKISQMYELKPADILNYGLPATHIDDLKIDAKKLSAKICNKMFWAALTDCNMDVKRLDRSKQFKRTITVHLLLDGEEIGVQNVEYKDVNTIG